MGLTMQKKKAVTRQLRSRCLKAGRKEKSAILDEIHPDYWLQKPEIHTRLLESEALSPGVRTELTRLCGLYNPVQLQHNVNNAIPVLREAVAAQFPSPGKEPAA
jgi:hypothetical protein